MLSGISLSLALLVAGILALYAGAELLVAGAGRLALGIGLRATTVGVTVIAFATTTPELFVATIGTLDVSSDIGLGAIIGSNIANIGLVLGVAALLSPLQISSTVLRRHVPFMVLAAVLLVVLGADGTLGRLEGALLLAVLAGFTWYLLQSSTTGPGSETETPHAASDVTLWDGALVIGGVVALVGGSRWLISGGTSLLAAVGVSEFVIGLTILAFGTSLPELAASMVGALRDETGFVIGTVVGSNIYNILAVLGIVALITPIDIAASTLRFELSVLLAFTGVLVALMGYGRQLTRVDGAGLVLGYAVFLVLLSA